MRVQLDYVIKTFLLWLYPFVKIRLSENLSALNYI